MKKLIMRICGLVGAVMFFINCSERKPVAYNSLVHEYGNILDIAYTPNDSAFGRGWFSDQGSWMGFTLPEKEQWINGFCGPFDLESRRWISKSLLTVGLTEYPDAVFHADSVNYFPGELFMRSSMEKGVITQRLIFIDRSNVLLECVLEDEQSLCFSGRISERSTCNVVNNSCVLSLSSGQQCMLTFPDRTKITLSNDGYEARTAPERTVYVIMSFLDNPQIRSFDFGAIGDMEAHPAGYIEKHYQRWNEYLGKVLRSDMPEEYNRIAVKAVVTLISNWRSSRAGLLHEGVVPSHAVGYFMGFWAWDSWKHAAALADFAPELAKNQIRAMFDYQLDNGMIIDCIYTDIRENNARDSKPPLAAWAVDRVFEETGDTSFVKEMYPQLLNYYRWWYIDRDHNSNGICEFGSVDGTLEAAAWESGMDNAIRFDDARMVKNSDTAWSFDQESVDLNAFLAYEYKLLKKLANVSGQAFDEKDRTDSIRTYFYDEDVGFFFDRRMDGTFVKVAGSEAYIPLWTGIATEAQTSDVMRQLEDTTKFSTYIPFPTVAADNPDFMPKGYWRGPIWLDQTYFAISGLRKYGYVKEADKYTRQVFDRLNGLKGNGAIHENYEAHTGERLKAPHFSWSAAHLLMLYEEYGQREKERM